MRLEELLVAKGLLQPADLERAAQRRLLRGGQLADSLLALRLITLEQLSAVLQMTPPATPSTPGETGLSQRLLLSLVLKAIQSGGADTIPKIVELLKLPSGVIGALIQQAVDQKLMRIAGSEGRGSIPVLTYGLTDSGRAAALEAVDQSKYLGPAPVSLAAYIDQINRQRLGNERATRERIKKAFSDLIVTEQFINRLGPAINSGKSILLYGPPGNGKSSIAERVGRIFTDIIYVPYCVEIEGQIIKIFDLSVHEEINKPNDGGRTEIEIRREDFDRRWVACKRPIVITGGEFTLDMLDLRYNVASNYYEAPLHVKALGGIFVLDDFGRQFVRPKDLLNRWIVPLEDRIDYLKLSTGATIQIPFDELVIFSTNLTPEDLMDPAFLRRIPYKIELGPPSLEDYRKMFEGIAKARGLELTDQIFSWVIEELQIKRGHSLASYQPGFITNQVLDACQFEGIPPQIKKTFIADALSNLYTSSASAKGRATANDATGPE
jgi:hypothetical protein